MQLFYWPTFEFSFSLDMGKLLPYLAAIETNQVAGTVDVLPSHWRNAPQEPESKPGCSPALSLEDIRARKLQSLTANGSGSHEWTKRRFQPGSAPLSLPDILNIHRLVSEETGIRYDCAGKLREIGRQVLVGVPGVGFHVGAPSRRLPGLMKQYVQLLTTEPVCGLPPAIHAMVAHFFFTAIHPFEDGNGRSARLVSAAILFQRGYNGHGFYGLHGHFYKNEERYHRILQRLYQGSYLFDLTEFVAFGLEGVISELQSIRSFLRLKLQPSVRRQPLCESMGTAAPHQLVASHGF